jgi:5'-methylthioadenosine phosphorylase
VQQFKQAKPMKRIGIIGGTGLEKPGILQDPEVITRSTPYGSPSSNILAGPINGTDVLILSRHGEAHSIPPSQVNNRANLWLLRELGCTHILATTACGSLREEIGRGHLVIPDQFIDFTRHRQVTLFEEFRDSDLKHTAMADPFSTPLRKQLVAKAREMKLPVHDHGTLITIEGPRFSTRAESHMFRAWGADIINMSTAPEVILSNELGIPYAAVAMSTDYDCWKEDEKPVNWEDVLKVFTENVEHVRQLIFEVLDEM